MGFDFSQVSKDVVDDEFEYGFGKKQTVLRGIAESLLEIQRQTTELSTTQLRVLIFVMRREKVQGTAICRALNLTRPTVSRCLATLSDDDKKSRRAQTEEPLGFLKLETDPTDSRVKYAVLTAKGHALATRIVELNS